MKNSDHHNKAINHRPGDSVPEAKKVSIKKNMKKKKS